MALVHWSDIEAFHNNRAYYTTRPNAGMGKVTYRAKIKLHGMCASVKRLEDGALEACSRETVLSNEADLHGFSKWATEQLWENLPVGVVVFGEWCGPGVMGGTALSQLDAKMFCAFAIKIKALGDKWMTLTEPSMIEHFTRGVRGLYVLPWEDGTIDIDWHAPDEAMVPVIEALNDRVDAVEACDPWVKRTFGVEGIGEGLVFYPVSTEEEGFWSPPIFKAKGEKHRVMKAKKAVQLDPSVVESIDGFVELFVTQARLEQGVSKTGMPTKANIGAFLKWFVGDVEKESKTELEASGLKFEQVSKAVMGRARDWYLAEANKSPV